MFHRHGLKKVVKETNRTRLKKLILKRQEFEKNNPYPPYDTYQTTMDFSDIHGKTLFYYAIEEGDITGVKKLVTSGIDINCFPFPMEEIRPMQLALSTGHLEIAQYLYEKGADCASILAQTAGLSCRTWFYEIIKKDALYGNGRQWVPLIRLNGKNTLTLIERAVEIGELDYLKKVTADPANLLNFKNTSPCLLKLASANGQLHVVDFLLGKDINYPINPTIKYEKSALQTAIDCGELVVAKYLLSWGAGIDWQDNYKNTALMIAVENKNIDAVQLLLEYHADVLLTNVFGNTSLHKAVIGDNEKIIKMILEHRDSSTLCTIKNIYGETPPGQSHEIHFKNSKIETFLQK